MELTKSQLQTLVHSLKSYRLAKTHAETAERNVKAKLESLKTACQGSGSPEQVIATANEHIANAYIHMPDQMDIEG